MKLQRADESRAMALYAQDNPMLKAYDALTWETLPDEVRILAEARFVAKYGRSMQPPSPADVGMTPEMVEFGRNDPPTDMPEDEFLRMYEYYYNLSEQQQQ